MFKNLFGSKKGRNSNGQTSLFEPRMPEVDMLPDIENRFAEIRKAANGEIIPPNGADGRHVIVVTPGRMMMFKGCPPPGTMDPNAVASIAQMMPSNIKRNVAVIAYNEIEAITTDAGEAIPFLGYLLGFAYIGHAVWVFEGHPSALAAGCRDADVLLVDGGMAPYLQDDWLDVVSGVMRHPEVVIHDRKSYSLRVVQ
jgi:hypothetical protein